MENLREIIEFEKDRICPYCLRQRIALKKLSENENEYTLAFRCELCGTEYTIKIEKVRSL